MSHLKPPGPDNDGVGVFVLLVFVAWAIITLGMMFR